MRRFLILLAVAALGPAAAFAETHAAQIADGKPWTTSGPTGGKMRLTLNPDGTGKMNMGFMSRKITWSEEGDAICLGGLPGDAARCITFRPVKGGFAGQAPDGKTLVLRR